MSEKKNHQIPAERLLKHYVGVSKLLAGQLDFVSALQAAAKEISHFLPHDHMDVCLLILDGTLHIAYETGFSTAWSEINPALVSRSPIRSVLWGQEDFILTGDAVDDPRFQSKGIFNQPIYEHSLRSRIHVPMKVKGDIIGALSCSSTQADFYTLYDVENAQIVADLLSPYFFALSAAEQAQKSAIVEAEARVREEGLRQGALNLTEVLEQERQRIGMDLHDQTLADLTRLARRLDKLAASKQISGADVEPLASSLQISMQDLRQIIEQATPSVLQLFGFAEAVENHLDRAIGDSGAVLDTRLWDYSNGAFDELHPTVRISLFRITQEAINNAVSHAGASRLELRLCVEDDGLVIEINDNGAGYAPEKRKPGGGLDIMQTRARLISGEVSLQTDQEEPGTSVRIRVPLKPQDQPMESL